MPKLTDATIAQRINQALEVLQMLTVDPKLTQKEACKRVGIEVPVYRRWITQASDAIVAFQQTIAETERVELAQILIAREQITERLIADALNRHTDPVARLQIKVYLDNRADQLGERHRGIDHEATRELFSGPELAPGESRFAGGQQVTVTAKPDGEVNVQVRPPQPVVDATFVDDPPPIVSQSPSEVSRLFGLPDANTPPSVP